MQTYLELACWNRLDSCRHCSIQQPSLHDSLCGQVFPHVSAWAIGEQLLDEEQQAANKVKARKAKKLKQKAKKQQQAQQQAQESGDVAENEASISQLQQQAEELPVMAEEEASGSHDPQTTCDSASATHVADLSISASHKHSTQVVVSASSLPSVASLRLPAGIAPHSQQDMPSHAGPMGDHSLMGDADMFCDESLKRLFCCPLTQASYSVPGLCIMCQAARV